MYELALNAKGVDVKLNAAFLGKDLLVWLTGGAAHIGAVAVAVPRPSLNENGGISADVSVIATGGHKEDMLARKIALALAGKLNVKVSVVAGMHWNNVTEEQLMVAQALSAKLAKGLLEQIEAGGPEPVAERLSLTEVAEDVMPADGEAPQPKYVSIKADLNADIKPGQTGKSAAAPKHLGVRTGTGSGPGAKPVVGKPISIKSSANKSISISTSNGRLVPRPSTDKPSPGADPGSSKPQVVRPPGANPVVKPGANPAVKPEARPAPKPVASPGVRPAARPGARPVAKPGARPAGARPPVKKSPPEFDE